MFRWKPDRPFAVFDIEATGTNPRTDRIIDLAIVKILPSGEMETHEFRVNPGIPIPPASTQIHGIRDEDVKDCPPFERIAARVLELLAGCDLGGYNCVRYDIPLLAAELQRANLELDLAGRRIIDAQRIFHLREPRDLSAALQFYCGETHREAHGALADALATIRVLEGQFEKYPDLPTGADELSAYCFPSQPDWIDRAGRFKWRDGEAVLNFGKKAGQTLREVARNDSAFLKWMLKSDFAPDTQKIVRDAMEGRFPTPEAGPLKGGVLGMRVPDGESRGVSPDAPPE